MPRTKIFRRPGELVPTQVPKGRVETDMIISLSKEELESYLKKEKTHFFRVNPWNSNVQRVWLYVKDPIKCITHVAYIGPVKAKGELGPVGQCNKAFNSGSLNNGRYKYKAAYEVRGVCKLAEAMPYSYIIQNGFTRPIGQANVYTDGAMAKELGAIGTEKVF
ncbi:hypothetical protein ABW20_dc0101169 [Dactylellina cionopaga]|nr:hypothetical protein ABW20_dc0101169 [Dactylellina cionopaga]